MNQQELRSLKGLPVGYDSFKEVINAGFYYVDKTPYIRKIIKDDSSKVLLIARPPRFGKSLTLNTISQFLTINPNDPNDHSYQEKLFANTKILEDKQFCEEFMGQYPVIFISFKDIVASNYTEACDLLAVTISKLASHHEYLLNSPKLSPLDKRNFEILIDNNLLTEGKYRKNLTFSLKQLTELLAKHYGKNVIVLIDEHDVPLAEAYNNGYYEELVTFMQPFLSKVLKGNTYLYKGVLTGCLTIPNDSSFTGLNHLKIKTVINATGSLAECMGFNKNEVKSILSYYDLLEHEQAVKDWYGGYRIADREIFCPSGVINFCNMAVKELKDTGSVPSPRSFWSPTKSDDIIQQLMSHLKRNDAVRLQTLMDGGEIELLLDEPLNYNETRKLRHTDDFLAILLYTGYLTAVNAATLGATTTCTLRIPNLEIRSAFEKNIKDYYSSESQQNSSNAIVNAFFKGDCEEIRTLLEEKLTTYVSVRDLATKATPENFYHGFLNGIFSVATQTLKDFKSNAEAGNGYADIIFTSKNNQDAVIIEIKSVAKNEEKLSANQNGLKQIEDKHYIQALSKENSDIKHVLCYGIAFCKKECLVRHTIKAIEQNI